MPNNTTVAGALLGLHAQTSMHPGAGTALGTVDLPIQRERHTGWPNIAGSALKGILRDAVRALVAEQADLETLSRYDDREEDGQRKLAKREGSKREKANSTDPVTELFGPPTAGSSEFGGAVSVTDARILAFPVRSLRGVHAWVTCPAVLTRLQRDADLAKLPDPFKEEFTLGDNQALVAPGCACVAAESRLILEEFQFEKVGETAAPVAEWIVSHVFPNRDAYKATKARFAKHLVILSDNDFTHFVRNATEVSARIALNYDTKTVDGGALFYQEFLPPETLLYAVVLANQSRSRRTEKSGADLLQALEGYLEKLPFLQIGGDETTGKGFCSCRLKRA